MTKKTGPTNEYLIKLIEELHTLGSKNNVKVWKVTARYLSKPSRQRIKVNLFKINKLTREGEIALVPGKILSDGDLDKKISVAGFQFSENAKNKISKKGKSMTIQELIKENPKGKNVRLIC